MQYRYARQIPEGSVRAPRRTASCEGQNAPQEPTCTHKEEPEQQAMKGGRSGNETGKEGEGKGKEKWGTRERRMGKGQGKGERNRVHIINPYRTAASW